MRRQSSGSAAPYSYLVVTDDAVVPPVRNYARSVAKRVTWLHRMCRCVRWCRRAQQLSRAGPVNAGFQCDKAAVLRDTIKWTFCFCNTCKLWCSGRKELYTSVLTEVWLSTWCIAFDFFFHSLGLNQFKICVMNSHRSRKFGLYEPPRIVRLDVMKPADCTIWNLWAPAHCTVTLEGELGWHAAQEELINETVFGGDFSSLGCTWKT